MSGSEVFMNGSGGPVYQLVAMAEVVRITTLSKSSVYDLVQRGKFPEPVILSEGRKAWVADEVHEWVRQRVQARIKQPKITREERV